MNYAKAAKGTPSTSTQTIISLLIMAYPINSNELQSLVNHLNIDIILLNEIHLKPSLNLKIPNYHTYRPSAYQRFSGAWRHGSPYPSSSCHSQARRSSHGTTVYIKHHKIKQHQNPNLSNIQTSKSHSRHNRP